MGTFKSGGGVFNSFQNSVEFCIEAAKLDFALELKRMMEHGEIKNTELAERLGVSKPMVSKLLRGDANATIETMVKASKAVGGDLFLRVVRNNCTPKLFEIVKAEHRTPEVKRLKSTHLFATDVRTDWGNFIERANGNEEKPIAA